MSDTNSVDNATTVLRLTIEVPGIWADDLDACASELNDPPDADARLDVVLNEWMQADVGLTVVTIPGENSNDEPTLQAYNARIVAAEARPISVDSKLESQ